MTSPGSSSSRRLPPEVYRRRRLVVFTAAAVILLLVFGLIWWAISALRSNDEPEPAPTTVETTAPAPAPSPSSSKEKASPSASTTPKAQECTVDDLKVTATTDAKKYGEGENPKFTMEIENASDLDCSADLGSGAQLFAVEKDEKRIFSTTYCQVNPEEQVVVLEPGQKESSTFVWERIGTDEKCENVNDKLEAGDYELVVGVGEARSEPTKFTLK